MPEERRLIGLDAAGEGRETVEAALFEMKRVIAGQDQMLERVLVCLLAGGHLLIEGVPGLAKTLTIKTAARVLGGTFQRVQFTPDLVPADLVGTRIYRPNTGTFDTELGPVFTNFLLADEINRAPAKVQSALLEVMQEQHGHDRRHDAQRRAARSSSWRRRTRSSPRAPIRCPRRRSTASCSRCSSTTPRSRTSTRSPSAHSPQPVEVQPRDRARRSCSRCRPPSQTSTSIPPSRATPCVSPPSRATSPPTASASSTRTSRSASAPAARSACCTPRARSPSCAGAATCCPPTCTSSRPTRCVTASCSRTARWPRASAPRPSSPPCSDKVPMPRVELVSEVA